MNCYNQTKKCNPKVLNSNMSRPCKQYAMHVFNITFNMTARMNINHSLFFWAI